MQRTVVAAGPPRESAEASARSPAEAPPLPEPSRTGLNDPRSDVQERVAAASDPPAGAAVTRAGESDESALSSIPPRAEADARPPNPIVHPAEPPSRQEILILFNRGELRFAEVVDKLVLRLPSEQYRLTLADVESEESLARTFRGRSDIFVVAVGLPAARFARDVLSAPIVFAEVFDYRELIVDGRVIHGVTAMPPLDLQVKDWKRLDPELQRLGLIVSEEYVELIPAALSAAQAAGLTLKSETSSSDQETLYLFRRMAPQIDGLWLVPDDGILSPPVLRELLDYAASHQIGVSVFADALLDWGALISAGGEPVEIARRVHDILERLRSGESNSVPRLSPLSNVSVRVNLEVADRLGLALPPGESWIVGDEP